MSRFRTLCFAAMLCLAGCEQEIVIDVKVSVPPEVQALYSKQSPGRLMVGMDVPKSSVPWYTLGVLCDPTDKPLVASLHHESFGCAKAGTVRAWIAPVAESGFECGLVTREHNAAEAPTAQAPQGTAVVFAAETGKSGCSSGKDQVEITIARP